MQSGNRHVRGESEHGEHYDEHTEYENGGAYSGTLNRAHMDSLQSIVTTLVQAPSIDNHMSAIFYARVVTKRGVFRSHGEANPQNVHPDFVQHFVSVAETRAKARALGDAINRGVIPVDELMEGVIRRQNGKGGNGSTPPPVRQSQGKVYTGGGKPITMNQLNRLHVLLEERGHDSASADDWLCQACKVEAVGDITRRQASDLITQLSRNGEAVE